MTVIDNTVRLTVTFTDWDNALVDPTGIVLRIYDGRKKQIGVDIAIGEAQKQSVGVYQYDYTVPDGADCMYAEFSGTSEGTVVLGRQRIERRWYE